MERLGSSAARIPNLETNVSALARAMSPRELAASTSEVISWSSTVRLRLLRGGRQPGGTQSRCRIAWIFAANAGRLPRSSVIARLYSQNVVGRRWGASSKSTLAASLTCGVGGKWRAIASHARRYRGGSLLAIRAVSPGSCVAFLCLMFSHPCSFSISHWVAKKPFGRTCVQRMRGVAPLPRSPGVR